MRAILLLLFSFSAAVTWAFPDEGKTYVVNRNGNTAAYMYADGSSLLAAALNADDACYYWQFVPTTSDKCFYILNCGTGQYVQSSVTPGLSQRVQMGDMPVEFRIDTDPTEGAATKGFYYMASTDNTTFQLDTDKALGLNFGASGVVSYYIKSGRGNSYWEITERTAPAKADPKPYDDNKPALATRLGLLRIPCGTKGAFIKQFALSDFSYEAKSYVSEYVNTPTTTFAHLERGKAYDVTCELGNATDETEVTMFADIDGNGSMEVVSGTAINIPADAPLATSILRVRVTNNGLTGIADDVEGCVYDFRIQVTEPATEEDGVTAAPAESDAPTRWYDLGGRQVSEATAQGIYIRQGTLPKKIILR